VSDHMVVFVLVVFAQSMYLIEVMHSLIWTGSSSLIKLLLMSACISTAVHLLPVAVCHCICALLRAVGTVVVLTVELLNTL
jgi:hypothetical protein